ncbi:SAF domain-containing protein [Microbispora bryophytorum]|uniref:Flagellar biosynthesis protein FlgA n=1 Tax=Microbispora bryophytorum subsp. camponoti TaxID=1677852 RepID=A0ABR8LH56_9ACTN|nr:SAF domain-containing protein [Microbispora camponoti]MBD3148141.1 flagellar biosynthesis protein FlgA [Microbispora camponoti]
MVTRDLRRLAARRRRPIAAVLAGLAVACVLLAVRTPDGVEVLAAARDLAGGRLTASDVVVVRLPPDTVPAGAYVPGVPVSGRLLAGPLRRGEPLTDARLLGPGLFRQTLTGQASDGRRADEQPSGWHEPSGEVSDGQAPEGPADGGPADEGPAAASGASTAQAGDSAAQGETSTAQGETSTAQAGASAAEAGMVATPVRITDPDAARLLSPGDVIDILAAFEDGPFQARLVAQKVRVIARPPGRTDGGALLVLATTPGQAAQLAQAQAQGRLFVTIHPH